MSIEFLVAVKEGEGASDKFSATLLRVRTLRFVGGSLRALCAGPCGNHADFVQDLGSYHLHFPWCCASLGVEPYCLAETSGLQVTEDGAGHLCRFLPGARLWLGWGPGARGAGCRAPGAGRRAGRRAGPRKGFRDFRLAIPWNHFSAVLWKSFHFEKDE